mmetsp:Transcript_113/g.191  ORF Transcript_113/g.191 Transcript_113/m.191 type:complete len:80 (-) Transcript_113:37-276(-)
MIMTSYFRSGTRRMSGEVTSKIRLEIKLSRISIPQKNLAYTAPICVHMEVLQNCFGNDDNAGTKSAPTVETNNKNESMK